MKVWCDGALTEAAHARIAPDDRGFLFGDGVFETIRVQGGRALHAARHLDRLRRGADLLGIPLGLDQQALAKAVGAVIAANGVQVGSARITLSRGPAPRGLATPEAPTPTLLVAAHAGSAPQTPLHLLVARCTRRNEFSPLSGIKSANYLDSVLARREAEAAGYDDALLLNTAGAVAESTTASVLVCLDGRLCTPGLGDGALPGIARALLIEAGLVVERRISPSMLASAETMILCNSLGVRQVASLDRRRLPARPELVARIREVLAIERA